MAGHEHEQRRRGDHERGEPLRQRRRAVVARGPASLAVGRTRGRAVARAAAQHHERHNHEHTDDHDAGELLGDTRGRVAEPVEDALPVLQVEEHRHTSHGEQRRRADEGRHLGAAPLARERRGALGPEEPGRPRHEGGEQYQGPLQLHGYSSPCQVISRRM